VTSRNADEWTIERWRLEPRLRGLDFDERLLAEQSPPLWKDLTLAAALAILLWLGGMAVFS
jgi:hypothetical protein